MKLSARIEHWELAEPFRIAGQVWNFMPGIMVELVDGNLTGRGEAQGVDYRGETPESMMRQLSTLEGAIRDGIDRQQLARYLPPGGARNALDCALWDLQCQRQGVSIWELTGIAPGPVTTVFTIGLEATPEAMADKARQARANPVLKIKLDADQVLEKLGAIREARPDARIVVDANQSWDFELLRSVAPQCARLDIEMIEQPLPVGHDDCLVHYESPVLLAADESCQASECLEPLRGRYGMVNIKLDKTGGLTEALALANTARAMGLKLMVGNMLGTSLAMAPSMVIARLCDLVDIDGPLLLKYDRPHGLSFDSGVVQGFDHRLWG